MLHLRVIPFLVLIFSTLAWTGLPSIQESPHSLLFDSETQHTEQVQDLSDKSSIEVFGAWRKSVLSVLIIPIEDERYTRWAGLAVDWWERAIETFTALYGYEYLRKLDLLKYVKGVNGTAGDIVIEFVPIISERVCGLAYPYVVEGEIKRAYIQLSLQCIKGREEHALIVALHELGHALGLGHTENSEDLMYEFMVLGARPSTLNLYALAQLYKWLERGVFESPRYDSVSLPRDIAYMRLLNENGDPVRFKIRVYLRLGGEEIEFKAIEVPAGENLEVSVDALIQSGNAGWERYVFNRWIIRGTNEVISETVSLRVKPTWHTDYVAIYEIEYRVVAEIPLNPLIDVWVRRGANFTIEAEEAVYISAGERMVFVEWRGTLNSVQRILEILVVSPVNVSAIYRREFLVELFTEHGEPVGSGWWPEGSIVNLTVRPQVISLGEGSRLVLRGFNGSMTTQSQFMLINVTSPMYFNADWGLQHLITVESLGGQIVESIWAFNSSTITLSMPKEVYWDEKSKSVFVFWLTPELSQETTQTIFVASPKKFTVYYERRYLVEVVSELLSFSSTSWLRPGEVFELEVPASVELNEGLRAVFLGSSHSPADIRLRVVVDAPLSVILYWRLEAKVSLHAPGGEGVEVHWVPLNSAILINAPSIIQVSEDESLEFIGWSGSLSSREKTVTHFVKEDMVLTPEYRKLCRVSIITEPPLKGVAIYMMDRFGRFFEVSAGSDALLRPGEYLVLKADWMGVDVGAEESLRIDCQPTVELRLDVRPVRVKVVDILGIPAPFYRVSALREGPLEESWSVTDVSGSSQLRAVSSMVKEVRATWMFFETRAEPVGEEVVMRAPLSFYSALSAAFLIIAVAAITTDRRLSVSAS